MLDLTKFKNVKNRLEAILANKDTIKSLDCDREEYLDTVIDLVDKDGNPFRFAFHQGVCSNGDLWSIDDMFELIGEDSRNYNKVMNYSFDYSDNTFLDKLGITFCLDVSKKFDYEGVPYCVSPIVNKDRSYKLWQNEQRWEYVEYCLEKINFVIETGKNPF